MVYKGDDEKFRSLKSGHKFFSKCVFWVDLYEGVVGLHFMRKHPNYWELRIMQQSIDVIGWII
jgi:hypothetical protein